MTGPASSSKRYVLERMLGRGGMATVHLARDGALDRWVALKVLAEHFASDQPLRDRFLREARVAAKIVHPNVVAVYDVGEDERGPFIVMEYVEGGTLADELRQRGRLPADEVVSIGIQLCSALEAAHAEQLVHRDIKPQNVLRRPDGQVKLADFGIARSLAATRHTEHGTVLGTAAYLAPEQARGEPVTGAADIYSLGVVLYELLTGQTPFPAETLPELLLKREQADVTPPRELVPEIPAALEAVVMRCLAQRPEHRPRPAVLARELDASIADPVTGQHPVATSLAATEVLPTTAATVPLRPAPTQRRTPLKLRRRHLLAAVVGVAALIALGLIIAALADSGGGLHAAGPATHPPPTSRATTTTTGSTATTSATSTAGPTTTEPPPATPLQAIASARAAISRALRSGQIDSGAANELSHRLDDIAKSLGKNNSQDAAHKLADLLDQVSGLAAHGGQISNAALAQISTPLDELAALLPTTPGSPGPPGHGNKGKPAKKQKT